MSVRGLGLCSLLAFVGCTQGPRGAEAFAGAAISTKTLENGVEIATLALGEGEAAVENDRVVLHYNLYLEDGTQVDSSHDTKPMSFLILHDDALIEGIQHGALGMRVGELRRIRVPPKLGYGPRAVGPIPPKATLRFDVELMELHPNPYD